MSSLTLAVVIPVHNRWKELSLALKALEASTVMPCEIFVIDDGSTEPCSIQGVDVLTCRERSGPAHARNIGARAASADVVLFLDSDVCVHPDTIERMLHRFEDSAVDAVIGSYDGEPTAPGFFSQYKNLSHHYTHQSGKRSASTFWTGCGAIRRSVFLAHYGFEEDYSRPAMEDIEFGYRLVAGGRRILLDRAIQVTHLKAWTLWTSVRSDIFDRAIPWTQLIMRTGRMPDDLNLRNGQRHSVCLVWIAILLCAGGLWPAAGLAIGVILLLNRSFYRFLQVARGLGFALKAIPMHLLYFAYCGAAFLTGVLWSFKATNGVILTQLGSFKSAQRKL